MAMTSNTTEMLAVLAAGIGLAFAGIFFVGKNARSLFSSGNFFESNGKSLKKARHSADDNERYDEETLTLDNETKAPDFQTLVQQGDTALTTYKLNDALKSYEEALTLQPREASVHFKIGQVLLQKENLSLASQAFKKAIEINPKLHAAQLERVKIAEIQNALTEAHQYIDELLDQEPEMPSALHVKIKLLLKENRIDDVIPYAEVLMDVDSSMAPDFIANLYYQHGNIQEALAAYCDLVYGDPALQLDYSDRIAELYYANQQYLKAAEYFKKSLQKQKQGGADSKFVDEINQKIAACYCNLGVECYELKDYKQAMMYYNNALSFDKKNADIFYNLGKTELKLDNKDKAYKNFENATSIKPEDEDSYYEMAVIKDEAGELKDAEELFNRILKINPKNPKANFAIGTLRAIEGEIDKAIEYFKLVIAEDPAFSDGYYNLGVAFESKKKFKDAEAMYQKAISVNQNHHKAISNLQYVQQMKK
ncbi:MAG: tetratricopeptide repeat protein [Cyanobacteria bacterium P01_H01_bin.74]